MIGKIIIKNLSNETELYILIPSIFYTGEI